MGSRALLSHLYHFSMSCQPVSEGSLAADSAVKTLDDILLGIGLYPYLSPRNS